MRISDWSSDVCSSDLPEGAGGNGHAVVGKLIGDTPSKPFGGRDEIAWSPDGRFIYFAMRQAGRIEALSTNLDIFEAPTDGSRAPVNLTQDKDRKSTRLNSSH